MNINNKELFLEYYEVMISVGAWSNYRKALKKT